MFSVYFKDGAQARVVADTMLDAVIDVLRQNTSSPLKKIRIVVSQSPALKDFYSSMQRREAADPNPKDKGGWIGDFGSKFIGIHRIKLFFSNILYLQFTQSDQKF